MNEKLRSLRIGQSLTQKELASKINSTDKNIWAYENGIATPPAEIIVAYANYFQVTTDYLLGRSDDFGQVTVHPPASALSDEEKEVIRKYSSLNYPNRKLIMQMLDTLTQSDSESISKKKKA